MKAIWSRRSLLALLALCLSSLFGRIDGVRAAAAAGGLRNLGSVEQFRDLYNGKVGVPRLVLLLSPT